MMTSEFDVSKIFCIVYTHHFNDHFPTEPGSVSCFLKFPSQFISNLYILSGQAKTSHILLDTVTAWLRQVSLIYFDLRQPLLPLSHIVQNCVQIPDVAWPLHQKPCYLLTNYCPSVLDTVGWVIWPVKIVPNMTYNVFGGTLNPTLPTLLSPVIYCRNNY